MNDQKVPEDGSNSKTAYQLALTSTAQRGPTQHPQMNNHAGQHNHVERMENNFYFHGTVTNYFVPMKGCAGTGTATNNPQMGPSKFQSPMRSATDQGAQGVTRVATPRLPNPAISSPTTQPSNHLIFQAYRDEREYPDSSFEELPTRSLWDDTIFSTPSSLENASFQM